MSEWGRVSRPVWGLVDNIQGHEGVNGGHGQHEKVTMSWLHMPSDGARFLLVNNCTLGESGLDSLGKYFVSFSSMSRKMCSLSGKNKRRQEHSQRTKQKNSATKRKVFQTIAAIKWKKKRQKNPVASLVSEASPRRGGYVDG